MPSAGYAWTIPSSFPMLACFASKIYALLNTIGPRNHACASPNLAAVQEPARVRVGVALGVEDPLRNLGIGREPNFGELRHVL
jgi:hypothetical protein